MSKTSKAYKIFMTSMIVIIAGLLLATGIIAVQKHLNLKMGVVFQPGVNVEIGVMNLETFEEGVLIIRNFDDGADKHVEVHESVTLQGNKLTLTQEFVEAHGMYADDGYYVIWLYINNYTPEVLEPSLDLSHGTAESLWSDHDYIEPYNATTGAGMYDVLVAIDTASVILPNTEITLDIQLKAIDQSGVLAKGKTFNKTLKQINNSSATYESEDTSITSITFGDYATYESKVSGVTGIDVSYVGDGSIKAYALDTDSNDTKETVYVLSENNIYANVLSHYMFCNFTNLTQVTFGNFDTSKVTDMYSMFNGCSSLTSLNLSSFDTSNVTDMQSMFYGCSALTSLNLSSFDTSNVTSMIQMFKGCSSLESLDLSSFDTSSVPTMTWMFQNCSALISLDVTNFDTSNVTDMGWMFNGCSNLTSLDVSSFNTSNVTYMGSMFNGCGKLTSLDLSSFDTSNVTYMGWMFTGCSALTKIYVSDKWSTAKVTSSDYMFSACISLVGAIAYDSTKVDKTYANYTTGYLTKKDATS